MSAVDLDSGTLPRPDGAAELLRALAAGLRLPEPMTVSAWADRCRYLPTKGAAEPGRWRTERTPYLREVMDCLSNHPDHAAVRRVVLMKSTQVGATETLNNWVGSVIDRERLPMLVVQPTIEMAERWSKQRLASMIDDTPVLRSKIAPARSRDSGNTTLLKEWPGGVLIVSGANSAASLRSMPACYLAADEVDAYPVDLDGEGDPLSLAEARTDTFPNRKIFICSTPTIRSLSVIAKEYDASDQRRYRVPCPHCAHYQPLEWEHLHWPQDRPQEAVYVCGECGGEIYEHHKTAMLASGRWEAERPDQAGYAAGFHLSALYTPIGLGRSWGALAEQYLRVRNDPVRLKAFQNTRLGLCNEDPEEKLDWEELSHAAEPYPLRSIPAGCLALTAGVDVQGNRWAVLVLGHGPGGEQWIIDYTEIYGDPTRPGDWKPLDDYLRTPLTNSRGVPLRIQSICIDAGYLQDDVILFTRAREGRGIHAVKGSSNPGRPIIGRPTKVDVRQSGAVIRHGAKLWLVGEDTGKARFFQILASDRKAAAPGARRVHFSSELDESFFTGLTAEVFDPNRRRWIKVRPRNEPLDCFVYASAAAAHPQCKLTRWTSQQWQRLREMVEPEHGDLFSQVQVRPSDSEPQAAPAAPPPLARRPPAPSPFGKDGWNL